MGKWVRFRFKANFEDGRPVIWPPLGPTWETGLSCDEAYSWRVAYFPLKEKHRLKEFWPEAWEIDESHHDEITFTSRFKCPDWWDEKKQCVRTD